MTLGLSFIPGSLKAAGEAWLVDARVKRHSETGWWMESLDQPVVVGNEIADWLRRVQLALIFPVEPGAATDYVRRHGVTQNYNTDTVEKDGRINVTRVYPDLIKSESKSSGPSHVGPTSQDVFGDLKQIAVEIRDVLETGSWDAIQTVLPIEAYIFPPESNVCKSHGLCFVSSMAAIAILREEFPGDDWRLAGGHPTVAYRFAFPKGSFIDDTFSRDGGMWNETDGTWNGHYWVEGNHEGQPVALDITADQFGWEPVLVVSKDDSRFRANYSHEKLVADTEDLNVKKITELTLDDWNLRRSLKRKI